MLYRTIFRLVLMRVDPEVAHQWALRALRLIGMRPIRRLVAFRASRPDPALRVNAFGLDFPTPVGVAAGFDKDATAVAGLSALGFGFVEVGTVTARPQPGNPLPRIHRFLGDRALANSMGFPSVGAREVADRLHGLVSERPVGVNVGKSRVASLADASSDYRCAVAQVAPEASYIVLNISSPNTPQLREMQDVELLRELVVEVRDELARVEHQVPLLLKIDPDLDSDRLHALADAAVELRLDGIVAVNTTVATDGLSDIGAQRLTNVGGISGPPLANRSIRVLRQLFSRCGDSLPLISVGGIETADDVWERILAGATLVQAYTAFVYGGPSWPRQINDGLAALVRESGYASVKDAVGGTHPAPRNDPGAADATAGRASAQRPARRQLPAPQVQGAS